MKRHAGNLSASERYSRWKQVGDMALEQGSFQLAEACFTEANDFSGLLLLYTSSADTKGLKRLAEMATEHKQFNVAFLCTFLTGDVEKAAAAVEKGNSSAEAALFARSYCSASTASHFLGNWRAEVKTIDESMAASLADPVADAHLFVCSNADPAAAAAAADAP
eukprot:GHVU01017107.1.p1 GENE.GHVU01017107.1~~GHVU01017107.1.p1  ORF type:complete len:164 (-),score=49.94 GHVU01017107.1:49-540(-)